MKSRLQLCANAVTHQIDYERAWLWCCEQAGRSDEQVTATKIAIEMLESVDLHDEHSILADLKRLKQEADAIENKRVRVSVLLKLMAPLSEIKSAYINLPR